MGSFQNKVNRGRQFARRELSQWDGESHGDVEVEAPVLWKGRRGRVDIKIIDHEGGHAVLAELKATDWDSMESHRVRPNALRHARQVWAYIHATLEDGPVVAAVVYPFSPRTPGRKHQVEGILNERAIQVVWRDDRER